MLVDNCKFRIQHKFDVEQVSEVFQVPAMRTLSLVLFSRPTVSPFSPLYFLSLAVCGWKETREKELEHSCGEVWAYL